MLCAAQGRIGLIPFSWWAVWDRDAAAERSSPRGVSVSAQRVAVRGVFELELAGVAAGRRSHRATAGRSGRASASCTARGVCGGRPVDARALIDESAGYHARHTAWRWSAGVGTAVTVRRSPGTSSTGSTTARLRARGLGRRRAARGRRRSAFAGLAGVGACASPPRRRAPAARTSRRRLRLRAAVRHVRRRAARRRSGSRGWGVMERHEVRW